TIRTNKLESELSKVKNEEVECDQDLINLEEQQKEYEQKLRSGIAFHKNVENQLSASNTEIERIQKRIEQMNEKIAAVRARNGGIDASPFEIELNSLKKSCQEKYEEQKQLERRWLQTRQQTVEEKQHFTAIKERLEELSDRLVIRKNEEFKAKKSLEDITNHRRVLEKETEKLNKDLENMELMVNKEKQKVETNGMNVEKNEERLDSMIQVMQEQVYKLEQKIEENRYRAENLARKNYECDISIGNWCQKLEILNEIRDTVSSEKVKKEFEDLKLTIHNLEGEEERIKREQEKILSSLEKIANYQSENIFSISARRSSDISFNFDSLQESNAQQHFKSLKAASRANLHIKYSEQQRKLRKSVTELEKIEEQVLSLEDNRKSLQQKATDISNEIDNSITRSKELESKTIQLDIEKLLMSIKLAVEQQKKKKTDLLVNKSEENQSIIAEDTLNRLEEEKSNLTEQMHDVIVGKNASFAPLLTSRYSLAVVNYIKEFADIQDIGK
ncbi:MAG: Coiled-coil domain-containing protein 40, partial [Paramarteilia canceri]